LADVLGADVYKNNYKEIGFLPLKLTETGKNSDMLKGFPAEFTGFHWHGDTFDLPKSACHLAFSQGCANQAFSYEENVAGLQFHIESNGQSIKDILKHCKDEITPDKFIQSESEILSHFDKIKPMEKLLFSFLDNFTINRG